MGLKWLPTMDMPSLDGKVAVVTGANGGIGIYTTKYLVTHGAKVYFTARSEAKGQEVIKTILDENPQVSSNQLIWLKLDLSDVRSTLAAAEELKAKEAKVDILINNAAYLSETVEKNDAGWELGMAVNHVGAFIFTNAIMPLLKTATLAKDADVRIVNVSTNAHYMFVPGNFPLDLTKPSIFDGSLPYLPWVWSYVFRFCFKTNMVRYGLSKLTLLLLTQELQRRLDEAGIPIICLSPHPGGVKSPGLLSIVKPIFLPVVHLAFISEDEGSRHQLYLATDNGVRRQADKFKGKYSETLGNVDAGHALLGNEARGREIWDTTAKEVDRYLKTIGEKPLPEW